MPKAEFTAKTVPLTSLTIHEREAFLRAGIDLLADALALADALDLRATVLPQSKGLARVLNLVGWELERGHEYLDGEGIFADQVIHLAIHHAMAGFCRRGGRGAALFAECLASAIDLCLVGKLSQAGEETDFLADTLESLSVYYEMYAWDAGDLEAVLASCLDQPYACFLEAAAYLFRFCWTLAAGIPGQKGLAELQVLEKNRFYPLAHHFHIANWLLTVRPLPQLASDAEAARTLLSRLQKGEASMRQWLQAASAVKHAPSDNGGKPEGVPPRKVQK